MWKVKINEPLLFKVTSRCDVGWRDYSWATANVCVCVCFKLSCWGKMWKTQSPPVSMETPSLSQTERQSPSTFRIRGVNYSTLFTHSYYCSHALDHWPWHLDEDADQYCGCVMPGNPIKMIWQQECGVKIQATTSEGGSLVTEHTFTFINATLCWKWSHSPIDQHQPTYTSLSIWRRERSIRNSNSNLTQARERSRHRTETRMVQMVQSWVSFK